MLSGLSRVEIPAGIIIIYLFACFDSTFFEEYPVHKVTTAVQFRQNTELQGPRSIEPNQADFSAAIQSARQWCQCSLKATSITVRLHNRLLGSMQTGRSSWQRQADASSTSDAKHVEQDSWQQAARDWNQMEICSLIDTSRYKPHWQWRWRRGETCVRALCGTEKKWRA